MAKYNLNARKPNIFKVKMLKFSWVVYKIAHFYWMMEVETAETHRFEVEKKTKLHVFN